MRLAAPLPCRVGR